MQGVISEASGGNFRTGFIGGATGHVAGKATQGVMQGDTTGPAVAARTSIAAIFGGTAAHVTGGNFGQDAYHAAMVHLFNGEMRAQKDHRRGLMGLGEKLRGESVRKLIASHDGDINKAASAYGIDANLLRAHIYEEQTHLTPLIESDLAESLGVGSTVGLGQVTVGKFGYTRDQLLDPATNIKAMSQLMSTFQGPLNTEYKATLYNCGSCTSVTDYGMRVKSYRESFISGKW